MQLKTITKAILITLGVIALGACTHTGKKNMDTASAAGSSDSSVEVGGAGQDSNYGNDTNNTKSAENRTIYYFDFDKSEVKDNYLPQIYAQANYLMSNPNAKIILEGHTDPRGSREYNVGLGERRANAVSEVLQAKGVNPKQIRVLSYGAEQLAANGRSESDYQLDRRAVIVHIQG